MNSAARLGRRHVHMRVGKSGDSTDMVKVEVSQHDMTHIGPPEAQLYDLLRRRFVLLNTGRIAWRNGPTRLGSRQSCEPNPVSTNASPLSVSTNKTWHTIRAPGVFMVPQLR